MLVSKSEEPSTSPGSREVEVTTRPPRFISCRGRRSSSPSICKTANWIEPVDCWTSRVSLWAVEPLATQVVLKARTLSSGVTSTWSRRPVWRCLELVSLADYKGLGLPQLIPKNLVIIRVSTRGCGATKPSFPQLRIVGFASLLSKPLARLR